MPSILLGLLNLGLVVGAVAGYCMNIIHILAYDFALPLTIGIVLQIVGIFVFPLGCLLGWIM